MWWRPSKRLSVRGAPAIGVVAAYGCVLGAMHKQFEQATKQLAASRPTAVNLFWAIERMKKIEPRLADNLLAEAKKVHDQNTAMCRRIGEHGLELLRRLDQADKSIDILTHCNAGSLATGGIGTATAPMYLAHQQGLPIRVYADETRPLLQGARLTAFELAAAGIDVTLICDGMAAQVMREGRVGMVLTGADRIAANGGHGKQDRDLQPCRPRPPSRDSFLRGGTELDFRPVHSQRQRHPHRTAQRQRDHRRLRPPHSAAGHQDLQPRLRRDPRGTDRGDRDGEGTD